VPRQITAEDLDALNTLVQYGLIEVAWIKDGIPSYRLAKEFTPAAKVRRRRGRRSSR
jgi:hypothetical protein